MWKMYYNKSRQKIQIWTQNRQLPTQFGELRKFEILWWSSMNTKHCFVFILSFVLPSYSISVHLNWVIGELVTIIGSTFMSHFQKELCNSLVLKCKMEKFFVCLFVSDVCLSLSFSSYCIVCHFYLQLGKTLVAFIVRLELENKMR